uniref:RING-type domain-containing protein n=1 Tax=Homalodisca liturata TaxID=320908 RepID=A0A1B6J6Y0_9HEMI
MEHRRALDHLLEAATCPVCLERLSPSLVCCVNGHALCLDCRQWQPHCPTCRGRFSTDRTTTLRHIVQALPERCPYPNCNVILWSLSNHKRTCSYRSTRCVACEWVGPVRDLWGHVNEMRHPKLSADVNRHISNFYKCIENNFRWINVFALDGHIFWRILENDPDLSTLAMEFICLATKEVNNVYKASILFKTDKLENSIKLQLSFDNNHNENRIYLCHDMLEHFVEQNAKLLYRLTVETDDNKSSN